MDCSKKGSTSNKCPDVAYRRPGTELRSSAHRHGSAGAHLTHLLVDESPRGHRRSPESSPPSQGRSRQSGNLLRLRGGLVALLATLLLVFLTPSLGQAQTVAVSNLGQTNVPADLTVENTKSYAQSFTTGSHSAGYDLTDIQLSFGAGTTTPAEFTAELRPHSGSNPTTPAVAQLTVPGTLGTGTQSLTAPSGTVLDASTTYYVLFRFGSAANQPQVRYTASDAEDSGGLSGWSIGDSRHEHDGSSWSTSGFAIEIAVRAAEKATVPGAPTGLTATEGHHAVKLDWTAPTERRRLGDHRVLRFQHHRGDHHNCNREHVAHRRRYARSQRLLLRGEGL